MHMLNAENKKLSYEVTLSSYIILKLVMCSVSTHGERASPANLKSTIRLLVDSVSCHFLVDRLS